MTNNYVDKEILLREIIQFRDALKIAKKNKLPEPRVPESVGKAILQIAEGMAQRFNFKYYTCIDDMQGDAVVVCLKAVKNFDPAKSRNPFGFFSQIVFHAFQGRIKTEDRHHQIKWRAIKNAIETGVFQDQVENPHTILNEIMQNQPIKNPKPKKVKEVVVKVPMKPKRSAAGLSKFMEG